MRRDPPRHGRRLNQRDEPQPPATAGTGQHVDLNRGQVIVWSNTAQSQNFRLFSDSQTVFAGGTASTIFNPVVTL